MQFSDEELRISQETYNQYGDRMTAILMRKLKLYYKPAKMLTEIIIRQNLPRGYS